MRKGQLFFVFLTFLIPFTSYSSSSSAGGGNAAASMSTSGVSVSFTCSSYPNINCNADYTNTTNCVNLLQDSQIQGEINSQVCCTGGSDAKKFDAASIPNSDACSKIKVTGTGSGQKLTVKVNRAANCVGSACTPTPTLIEETGEFEITGCGEFH